MTATRHPSFALIANPTAGRGRGETALEDVAGVLRSHGREVRPHRTTARGDAAALAHREALKGASAVIAIGGDGTLNEVLNGLMAIEAQHRPVLGVIPAGTGNDYALELGMPLRDASAAAQVLLRGETRRVDVGHLEGSERGPQHFGVGVGCAMLAAAGVELQRSRPLPGRLSYFVGGVRALLTFEAEQFTVAVDGESWSGPFLAVHTGLCRTTGGGFCLTPDAGLETGRLHVNTVGSRRKLIGLLQWPWISRGRRLRGIKIVSGKQVRIEGDSNLLIHVDGELQRVPYGVIKATIKPRELSVISASRRAVP